MRKVDRTPKQAPRATRSPYRKNIVALYRAAGWDAVFPLIPTAGQLARNPSLAGQLLKSAPPFGYTGSEGKAAAPADHKRWCSQYPMANIGLRLPDFIICIDIDQYNGKQGVRTLRQLEKKFGVKFPPTLRATSRGGPMTKGGKLIYRLGPEHIGLAWPGTLGDGIETLHHTHRYAMVYPSRNPNNNGRKVRWYRNFTDLVPLNEVPHVNEAALLPGELVVGLTDLRPREVLASAAMTHDETDRWISERPAAGGPPCAVMAARGRAAVGALTGGHDAMRDALFELINLANEGHSGVATVLGEVGPAWHDETTRIGADGAPAHPASIQDPYGGYRRVLVGGIKKVVGSKVMWSQTGCPCGDGPGAAVDVPSRLPTLPETFWESRLVLSHIRAAAQSRRRSADVVLHGVLAWLASYVTPAATVDTGVASPASLNYFVAIVGPAASGKSSAEGIARELLAPGALSASAPLLEALALGSGEGLVEAYMGVADDPVTGRKVRKQTNHYLMIYVDEGEALTKTIQRSGATIGPLLRQAWTGKGMSQLNADPNRKRAVVDYSMGVVIGYQMHTAQALLDDGASGTPQRFMWVSTRRVLPPEAVDWPGALNWSPELLRSAEMEMVDTVKQDIQSRDDAAQDDESQIPELDGHAPLSMIKVSGLLALLDGRSKITEEDWALAEMVWETSCAVRDAVIRWGATQRRTEARRKDDREVALHERKASAASQVEEKVARIAKNVANGVAALGIATRKDLRDKKIHKRDRDLLNDAIQHALSGGLIVVADAGYAVGPNYAEEH